MVGAVVYAKDFDAYVAVSDFGSKKPGESGFYYSVSTDLVHWSEGRLFLPLATPWTPGCDQDHFAYPSLIDVDSPSRNFDVAGEEPYLYFVRQRLDGCRVTMQRDLVRTKMRLLAE